MQPALMDVESNQPILIHETSSTSTRRKAKIVGAVVLALAVVAAVVVCAAVLASKKTERSDEQLSYSAASLPIPPYSSNGAEVVVKVEGEEEEDDQQQQQQQQEKGDASSTGSSKTDDEAHQQQQQDDDSSAPRRRGAVVLRSAGRRRRSGCYLVQTVSGASPRIIRGQIRDANVTDENDFSFSGFRGFSLCNVRQSTLDRIMAHNQVEAVEEDAVVTASAVTWGLDRIDQLDLPLDNSYNTNGVRGDGVDAFIVDTGILSTHTEFGGRVVGGASFVGGDYQDCNGHGSHVAGTVGGSTYGVAPGVSLFAVRVLDCSGSGSTSGVIAGLSWVAQNVRAGRRSIVNMSLGGGVSSSLDTAVRSLVSAGIVVAVAAGNEGADACLGSPSRVAEAITVGATSNTDVLASWSNWGSCVDILAPGVGITSAWYTSTTATSTISGTSMATPHVAGAAALFLARNPSATPAQVAAGLIAASVANTITSVPSGTVNKMLYISPFLSGATLAPVTAGPTTAATTRATTLATTRATTVATTRATTLATTRAATTARPTTLATTRAATTLATTRAATSAAATTARPASTTQPTPPRSTSSAAPAATTRPTTTRPATTAAAATTTTASGTSTCIGNVCETGSVADGGSAFHPNPAQYYCVSTTTSVTHRAILRPGSDAVSSDLDLYLWMWDAGRSRWVVRTYSASATSNEEVRFTATGGGCFGWEVYSYSGAGSYTIDMTIPA